MITKHNASIVSKDEKALRGQCQWFCVRLWIWWISWLFIQSHIVRLSLSIDENNHQHWRWIWTHVQIGEPTGWWISQQTSSVTSEPFIIVILNIQTTSCRKRIISMLYTVKHWLYTDSQRQCDRTWYYDLLWRPNGNDSPDLRFACQFHH